jgi:hypothetical protein
MGLLSVCWLHYSGGVWMIVSLGADCAELELLVYGLL